MLQRLKLACHPAFDKARLKKTNICICRWETFERIRKTDKINTSVQRVIKARLRIAAFQTCSSASPSPQRSESGRLCSRDGERKEDKRQNGSQVAGEWSTMRACVCMFEVVFEEFLFDWRKNNNKIYLDIYLRFFAHKHRFTTRTKQSGSFARESRPTSHTPPNRQCVQIWAKTQKCREICEGRWSRGGPLQAVSTYLQDAP